MKLLIFLTSLLMVALISCGDSSPDASGISWDDYRSQIDNWQKQVDAKLAEASALLEAGPLDDLEWLSSVNQLGIEIDSITFAVSTVHPPSELQDFHSSFVLASDFYKLVGKLLFELAGDSEEDRVTLMNQLSVEIKFGEANMATAQSIYDMAAQERDR
ncbi:MAG TPA: hypothetical protein EYM73_02950 [Dehalococcoidia bacterium]|nr:hypothetical protein [Dehalococcoidia bacterium]HIN23324.1 hypothetical protein [Dehalococcoidia bacterium]